MKYLKFLTAFLIISGLIFLSISCSSGDSPSTTKTTISTARKGTISTEVTGTGNLALSQTENLAFEIAGTVEAVLVEAGESVTEGQELARLDTSVWDDQIKSLEQALVTAQRNLTTKESNLTKAERQVTSKELAVRSAELDLQTAKNNVELIADVKEAQDVIDKIESDLNFAKQMRQAAVADETLNSNPTYWNLQIQDLNNRLVEAQKDLEDILSGTSVKVADDVALQVTRSQFQVEQSQRLLEDAQIAVEDAKIAAANAQLDKEDAEQMVKDAQTALDEAKGLSPVIKAPSAGFITKVNVQGGDDVQKGTVAMQLADPDQFEANIQVAEQDVSSINLGQAANVSLDAVSGLNFPATITAIAPLATVSQGVVSYKVTVELTSLQPVSANQSMPVQSTSIQTSSGSTNSTASAISPPSISLKDGLSAVVNIVIQQKQNVILVPTKAITRQGQNTTVQVINGTITETRVVKTGMSDSQNTEIIEGLNEGEQVAIKTTSSSSSSSSNSQQGMPGIGIGGPGGF